MSEKSEVQNLEEPTEASEPLDAAPDAEDAGQTAQGAPKEYGEEERDEAAALHEGDDVVDR
mgnify:CR=1 FL=1